MYTLQQNEIESQLQFAAKSHLELYFIIPQSKNNSLKSVYSDEKKKYLEPRVQRSVFQSIYIHPLLNLS